jgi:uncharacterized protein (TIGR03435 family)
MQLDRMLVFLAVTSIAAAQTPAFDVASVKPEELTGADQYFANLGRITHGELTMGNVTLSEAVRFAWGINNDAQVAGPEWIKSKMVRYKIDAKTAPDTPRDKILPMLQALLTERFQLKTHIEQREIAHLELVPGRKELKIHPAEEGSDGSANRNGYGHIVSNRMTMEALTTILSRFLRQPILDRSGLQGGYAIDLTWLPEPRTPAEQAAFDPAAGPSIYSAVQEQLGLKLEARKTPLPVIVIDHAEQVPIGN